MAKTKKGKTKPRRKVGVPTKTSGRAKSVVSKAKNLRKVAAKRRAKLAPKRASKASPSKTRGTPSKLVSPAAAKKQNDQNKKAESLMASGRQRGFVTYDEILKAFPNIETDVDFLEELYDKFSTAHIDVLEGGGMLEIESEPLEDRKSVV